MTPVELLETCRGDEHFDQEVIEAVLAHPKIDELTMKLAVDVAVHAWQMADWREALMAGGYR